MDPQVTTSGQHPDLGSFFHVLLPQVEEGVTRFLTIIGGKATLHKFLATGEYAAQELDIPMLKMVLGTIDGLIGA